MPVAISPDLIGRGESLAAGIDVLELDFQCTEQMTSAAALHMGLAK